MPRVVAIVQARTGSSRLPGKALLAMKGRPLLAHVVKRVMATRGVDETILATSLSERDAGLVDVVAPFGVATYRGSEWDVLGRVLEAARIANADVIMRVTADCPLFCPEIAEQVLAQYFYAGCHPLGYCWNDTVNSGYPDGTDVEVFSIELLTRAHESLEATEDAQQARADREHVTPPVRRLAQQIAVVLAPVDLRHLKLSVDRPVDFDIVSQVASRIQEGDYSWDALLHACIDVGLVAEHVL